MYEMNDESIDKWLVKNKLMNLSSRELDGLYYTDDSHSSKKIEDKDDPWEENYLLIIMKFFCTVMLHI